MPSGPVRMGACADGGSAERAEGRSAGAVAYFAQEHGEAARRRSVHCAVLGSALVTLDGSWTDADHA
ncbi:hypothetical protein EJ357_16230 [Streptomyces cyaneochromogenes]|uniref:Uncharacterized protein n=1 Tax=Streptomyces cyaneochromogenes TaxID=2496836 RepID=A0A3S9M6N7_9ACTN|nr:hypothetical protein [Streptomyces cyaneochromogenes]AZQ34844.1 hypothetical protein EJ357_16230 [Streptomyces cyaneochromogenes]